jgi:hypothetical protein
MPPDWQVSLNFGAKRGKKKTFETYEVVAVNIHAFLPLALS